MSCTDAAAEPRKRIPMKELIPAIDEFVLRQYEEYPKKHGSFEHPFDLVSGDNRVVAFEEIMQYTFMILSGLLMSMKPHNSWVFMQWLQARELRLLNKTGAGIDPDSFDPYLTDELI